ncbi:hypothetical protein G9U51_05705 [Calidifontibacter sp. DB0510]|uniref:Uncharacterized protein n=1 Tax=Metallococcus carri TaxID=1656884 RepID=A0A967EGM6_9MICO|nr:hypothetical protein [Metallococcus carri]NHN55278.1 hypothetical protein [Metallococcus carri]NOP36355.1 hypothetical protein [Calidifontibacter sp. DB2511S]
MSVLINQLYGRGRPRPLHPVGVTRDATWLVHSDPETPVGVPIIDDAGSRPCVLRHSRAIGLPAGAPDIEGLAVHLPGPGGGDLLFAGTGDSPLGRHVLVPRVAEGSCSTLIPMRTTTGPILLRMTPATTLVAGSRR